MTDSEQKIQYLETQIDILNASLNDSQYLSNIGSWNWNVLTNEVKWSDNMFRILGHEPNEIEPSYELALHHVHESDKEKYEDVLQKAIQNKTIYYLENRIIKKNNSLIFVISRGKCVFDDSDNLIQMHGTVQDVSTQKYLEEALKEKVRAEEAEKVRTMFLSILSHELKHPFLILKNYSKLFIESMLNSESKKAIEFAGIIKDTSDETFNAINNLLEWTQANSSKLIYNPEKINFKKLIEKITLSFVADSNKKNISIVISENPNLDIYADKNVLNIIFKHLIENAIKFTQHNGQISIAMAHKNNEIEFSVTDNGVGIDEELQTALFSLDKMFSTSGTDGELGTGIGLKICKTLVKKHNGTILINSEIGKGTTCIFTLPNPL